MSKSCIICYRVNHFYDDSLLWTSSNDPGDDVTLPVVISRKRGETLRRFFKLLDRYLDRDNPGGGDASPATGFGFGESLLGFPLLEQVLDAGVLSCGDCLKVVESFCDLYHKMTTAQLMLNWRLWTLKGIMSSSERVPARLKDFRESANQLEMEVEELGGGEMGDAIIDFKKDLVRKCRSKLRNSFPQVLLSREMAEAEPEPIQDSASGGNIISQVNLESETQKPMKKRGRKRKHQPAMTGRSKILSNAVEVPTSNVPIKKRKRGRPRKNLPKLVLIGRPSKRLLKASWIKRAVAGGKAARKEKVPAVKEPDIECEIDADLHLEDIKLSLRRRRWTSSQTDMEEVTRDDDTGVCLKRVKIECEETLRPEPEHGSESFSDFVPRPRSATDTKESQPTGKFEHEEHQYHPPQTLGTERPLPESSKSGSMEVENQSSDSDYLPDPSEDSEDEDVGAGGAGGSDDDSESDYYNEDGGDHSDTPAGTTSKKIYHCNFEACPTPRRDYSNQEDLEIHLKLHGEFNCSFCQLSHSFAPDLALHEVTEHSSKGASVEGGKSSKEVFRCPRPDCRYVVEGNKSLFIQHHLKVHMMLNPYLKPISCDICKLKLAVCKATKPSTKKRYLRKHYNVQHNPDNLKKGSSLQKCDQKDCAAYFLTTTQLEIHKVRIHKVKNWFPCGDCDKRYPRFHSLAEHRANTHLSMEDLVHRCNVPGCTQRFETERQLKNHIAFTHSEKKRDVTCSKCGKAYKGKAALIQHMKSHDEEAKRNREPVCEVCGKVFEDKGKLAGHLKTHSSPDSWTFLCTLCPKKCLNEQRLKVHMRMHTQEKPFVCDLCGLKYAHGHNLKIHMKASHPGVTLERARRGPPPRAKLNSKSQRQSSTEK